MRVVLDSNILISATTYKGKPRQILSLILEKKFQAFTSPDLLAEFVGILRKKFRLSDDDLLLVEQQIKDNFKILHPRETIKIVRDESDNKVLETAIEGNCQYIVTGDNDLLTLGSFRDIKILTASEFLAIFDKN